MRDTWDVENWEAVIAYTLTNEALGKIVNGILIRLIQKHLERLCFVVRKSMFRKRDVELYHYRKTAPREYYGKLEANLELLKRAGWRSFRMSRSDLLFWEVSAVQAVQR